MAFFEDLKEKWRHFTEHFSWDARQDVLVSYFMFHNKNRPMEDFSLKGKVFETEDKAKRPYKNGGSMARNFKEEWFMNGLNLNRAFFIRLEQCSHSKEGQFMIAIIPENVERDMTCVN